MHDPERYEVLKSPTVKIRDKFVEKLLENIKFSGPSKKNGLILDYGCGTGNTCSKFLLPIASKYNFKIHAVDISKEMVEYCELNYPNPLIKYFETSMLDSTTSNHPNDKYELIFSNLVLHWISDYRGAIFKLMNMLSPDGQMAHTVCTESNFLFQSHEFFGTSTRWGRYMEGYKNYIPDWYTNKTKAEISFSEAVRKSGGKMVTINAQEYTMKHNFTQFIDFALSLNPFIKSIPENLHDELSHDYRKFLASCNNLTDIHATDYEVTYEILTFVATK